jgi:hypothetical protein
MTVPEELMWRKGKRFLVCEDVVEIWDGLWRAEEKRRCLRFTTIRLTPGAAFVPRSAADNVEHLMMTPNFLAPLADRDGKWDSRGGCLHMVCNFGRGC